MHVSPGTNVKSLRVQKRSLSVRADRGARSGATTGFGYRGSKTQRWPHHRRKLRGYSYREGIEQHV